MTRGRWRSPDWLLSETTKKEKLESRLFSEWPKKNNEGSRKKNVRTVSNDRLPFWECERCCHYLNQLRIFHMRKKKIYNILFLTSSRWTALSSHFSTRLLSLDTHPFVTSFLYLNPTRAKIAPFLSPLFFSFRVRVERRLMGSYVWFYFVSEDVFSTVRYKTVMLFLLHTPCFFFFDNITIFSQNRS